MKITIYKTEPTMEPYDDNNIQHVLSGPDYGQPWYFDDGIELNEENWLVYVEGKNP